MNFTEAEYFERLKKEKSKVLFRISLFVGALVFLQSALRFRDGAVVSAYAGLLIVAAAFVSCYYAQRGKVAAGAHAMLIAAMLVTGANQLLLAPLNPGPLLQTINILISATYFLGWKWGILYGVLAISRAVIFRLYQDLSGVRIDGVPMGKVEWYISVVTSFCVLSVIVFLMLRNNDNLLALYRNAARFRAEFLAKMSHEIRNPLNGILGIAELLQKKSSAEETEKLQQALVKTSQHLLHIVNQVLDLSRAENHFTDPKIFRPADLVEDVVMTFRTEAERKGTGVSAQIAPNVPEYVTGFPNYLRQVLINLVHNGIKFSPGGVVTVLVAYPGVDFIHPTLRFSVVDNGCGIAAEVIPELFKPYIQAPGNGALARGTGLGLAVCLELCKKMRGQIGVISEPGKGSTFTVDVPVELTTGENHHAAVGGEQARIPLNAAGQPLCILSIEDDEVNRLVFASMLKDTGMIVDFAENGSDGVAMAQKNLYDLYFIDKTLPDISGIEVIRQIRESEKNAGRKRTHAVLATADILGPDVSAGGGDFDAIMFKPFSRAQVLRQVLAAMK